MNYKLCILSAGRGTRNNSINGLHKSLLPIENKAAISHIIDKTPKEIEIVIAVGFKSDQIKTFINRAHPDRKIVFVDVENYDKPGSGPGLSLLCCKNELQCPFVFVCSDTLTDENYDFGEIKNNWIGVAKIKPEEAAPYSLVAGDEYMEKFYYGVGTQAYMGVAGIFQYEKFFQNLTDGHLLKNEHQVLNAFTDGENITLDKVKLVNFTWYDVGTEKSYKKLKEKFPNEIVAPKNEECIYIQNGIVIKYFFDNKKVDDLIERTKYIFAPIPKISKINNNMISYDYIRGKTVASISDENILKKVIPAWYEGFGKTIFSKNKSFVDDCKKMYYDKTYERCRYFSETELDNINDINGIKVDKINNMLSRIDWNKLYNISIPTLFHGDLQTENIIYDDKEDRFIFLDWRVSFGNSKKIGDIYYELAKLYHGLLINGTDINNKLYKIKIEGKKATISHHIRDNLLFLIAELKEFVKNKEYDWKNIKLLTALQYLCMSSLYKNFQNGEFGQFLFLYGKFLLAKLL